MPRTCLRVSRTGAEQIFGPKWDEVTGMEKITQRGALWPVLHTKYSGDRIRKNEVDRACSAYGVEKRGTPGFGGETSGKETTWKT